MTMKHKTFDGKDYVGWAIVSTKKVAEETVKGFRESGYLARFTGSTGAYEVWVRKK